LIEHAGIAAKIGFIMLRHAAGFVLARRALQA